MKLHFIMQPKGGAGKSFAAVHLIQSLSSDGDFVEAYDLDSANNTLSQFTALKAHPVDIRHDDNPRRVDLRKFDTLLEQISQSKMDHVVVDIGASIIDDFLNHCDELKFFDMVEDLGIGGTIIHVPISGGQGFLDNLGGLKTVYDYIGGAVQYVVWANPYFGELVHEGVDLENTKALKAMSAHLVGIIKIPVWDSDTKKDDVKKMVMQKLTYDEVANSDDFPIFSKSRLKVIREDFFARIDAIGLTKATVKA